MVGGLSLESPPTTISPPQYLYGSDIYEIRAILANKI